ncbi:hypothetical protein PPERSA_08181 [Pseudocohnilembus persalinus]|uniref:Calmodulin n=1 Tax=Pseudocohnilembus persalinus TaxID=266149 RepID=A0A0V0R396_PSEPJ|nr:hypothetical protein PPERSA_08181 [Pseudocohnilembus persalinus]|eukprot:KRX08978.1 hypothetical protein PPERSA_08181 [Pseudocohnilembus persalinus]
MEQSKRSGYSQNQQNESEEFKCQPKQSKYIFNSGYNERKWLKNRGKEDYIDFKDDQILELRKYFRSLDADDSGSIGVEELEDPLIAVGLAQTRQEVQALIDSVDDDKSGQIEFNEFLQIMSGRLGKKGDKSENEKKLIFEFFKKMSTGQLSDDMDKNIPFRLNVSTYRRRKILEAIMQKDTDKGNKGMKILNAFKKQINTIKQLERGNNDENLDDLHDQSTIGNGNKGFPKMARIVKPNDRVLIKPKTTNIQNNK